MPIKQLKAFMPHITFITNIAMIIGTIFLIAFGAFAIRMQQGPMDLDFAKARLEKALSNAEQGYDVKIAKINLIWPEIIGPVLLDLKEVRIVQGNVTSLSVDSVALGLSGLHLLVGNVMPSRVIIDGPAFHLVEENGSYNFFWRKKQDVPEGEEKHQKAGRNPREIRSSVKDFFESVTDTGREGIGALSALKRFEVKRAVITTTVAGEEQPRYLALADISLKKNFSGLQGDLKITLPSAEGQQSYLRSDISYRRNVKDLTFTAEVKDVNPARYAFLFPEGHFLKAQDIDFNGAVQAAFDKDFKLQLATLNLNIPKGSLTLPEIYDAPVSLENVMLDTYLDRPDKILDVRNVQGVIGNVPLQATAKGIIEKGLIETKVELNIAEVNMDDVPPIFPKSHLDSSAGEWLTHKLSKGKLTNVVLITDFSMRRDRETKQRSFAMDNPRLSFNAEGLTVKYSDTLMPVTDVKGEGVYENDTLTVLGQHGKIGDITGTDVVLKMTDLSVDGGGLADIKIKANGPLKTALQYVADEPIAVSDQLGFDVNQVKGNIDMDIQLNFPTVKDLPKEEVEVDIKGTVTDLLLPDVVKGLPLTGGPYKLTYDAGLVSLKGSGQLSNRPITLEWQQYLDSEGKDFDSKITAQIIADDGLRDAFGIGLEEYISGPMPVDVTYVDEGVKATIDVKGNLEPTTLHIKPFDYLKNAGIAGDLSLKALMSGDTLKEVNQLAVKTKGLEFSKGRVLFRKLKDGSTDISRGSIPSVTLGQTTVNADFEVTPENILKIIAKGNVIDINPFIKTDKKTQEWAEPKKSDDDKPMIISVSADKMIAKDGESLSQSKIYMETNKTGDITRLEMDSKVGDGTMYLRFKPEAETGKRTFRMESTDAGYTLKAFGLYDKLRGGKLTIYGQPAEGDNQGNLYGEARIDNFHVKGAPALAKLLDAMSMNGVQKLLTNEGVSFARLESNFEWQFHDGGNFLIVRDGRTSGSSLGLTFEGNVDQAKSQMKISGTIVPVSGLNNMVGSIPLIGNILTGGDALIAATYTVSGPTNDPKVSVNPLSVLAPGFLRKILFESSPQNAPSQ